MKLSRLLACLLAGVFFGALTGPAIIAAAELPYTSEQLFDLTNQERVRAGLEPFLTGSLINQAAQKKAEDMSVNGYFAHRSPSGQDAGDWLNANGYEWRVCGENIAFNYETTQELIEGWMSSSGHRANILSSRFKEMGIGLAMGELNGKTGIFAVQIFTAGDSANAPMSSPIDIPLIIPESVPLEAGQFEALKIIPVSPPDIIHQREKGFRRWDFKWKILENQCRSWLDPRASRLIFLSGRAQKFC